MAKGRHGVPASTGDYAPFKTYANIFIAFVGAGILGLPFAFKESGVVEGSIVLVVTAYLCCKAMLLLLECKDLVISRASAGSFADGAEAEMLLEEGEEHELEDPYAEDHNSSTTLVSGGPAADSRRRTGDQSGAVGGGALGSGRPLSSPDSSSIRRQSSDAARSKQASIANEIDYGAVGLASLGTKAWWSIQVSIVMSQVFFGCAYLIFIRENVASFTTLSKGDILLGCLVPLLYLCNLRDLNDLALFSMIAMLANFLGYFVVFYFDGAEFEQHGPHARAVNLDGIPFMIGVAIYCFEGAGMVISLEMSIPIEHRKNFPKIFGRSMVAIVLLYIIFGSAGYVSFGEATEKIITLNLPQGLFPLTIKFCLSFSLFFTFPVMFFPVSTILDKGLSNGAGLPYYHGVLLRTLLVAASGIIVILIPDFAVVMGLVGSSCCMLLALIMPPLMHLKLFGATASPRERAIDYVLLALGVTGALLGLHDTYTRFVSGEEDSITVSHPLSNSNETALINASGAHP